MNFTMFDVLDRNIIQLAKNSRPKNLYFFLQILKKISKHLRYRTFFHSALLFREFDCLTLQEVKDAGGWKFGNKVWKFPLFFRFVSEFQRPRVNSEIYHSVERNFSATKVWRGDLKEFSKSHKRVASVPQIIFVGVLDTFNSKRKKFCEIF